MIAFEYTEGSGVLLTAAVAVAGTGGTLGGVALAQRSARKAERERRDHEMEVRTLLATRIEHARRDLGRIVLLGLIGTTISTAALALATIILAL